MRGTDKGVVYLICFKQAYKHARHYMGWTTDLAMRLQHHAAGQGARLLEVVNGAGITWRVARVWDGARQLERRLKNHKHAARLCPFCSGARAFRCGRKKNNNE